MAVPVYIPFAFIALLVGGLGIFSRIYRNRQATRTYVPWFPSHPERDTYITLLQTEPKPSDALLKAALLRRAVADVRRIFRIRDDKAALSALLQKGSIDDELWANFQTAEKELEAEIVEVVTEANTFVEGWGQIIFQSAGEIVQNEKHRDIFTGIPEKKMALAKKLGLLRPAVEKAASPITASQPSPPASTPAPSITVTAAAAAANPKPMNNETIPPSNTTGGVGSSISTPNGSPMKTSQSLPPVTPSKEQPTSPPASIGKSAGKKKNKKK
ncbi:hypothetical protein DL93DRAFT_2074839 [Clavulina sp. PMI_390]|nr:hypothetical protein DL93DRAFT_2074839 [Clavulina sp. PMI_390]